MKDKQKYRAVVLMSGTSLDGLDIVLCEFTQINETWNYRLLESKTIHYSDSWKELLNQSFLMSASSLVELDHLYGKFLGTVCRDFLSENGGDPAFIASHGHTVFHRPDLGYSLQIGNGHDIATVCEIPVIYDFRSQDISLGGQGAPLVPAGDRLLFSDYDLCLNIGGFANLSFDDENGQRLAYDICPANTILNMLASRAGKIFDTDGSLGKKGRIIARLLDALNQIGYYRLKPPKSLGREFLESEFMAYVTEQEGQPEDLLRTIYEHISLQISQSLNIKQNGRVLVTGGGARNKFLIELLKEKSANSIIVPGSELIDYKEAIVFAFLGLLRFLGENNCLASATGASSDSSGGVIIWPGRKSI